MANTVIHYHANIRKCLQYAFQIGMIRSNPADRVERPRKEKFFGRLKVEMFYGEKFESVKAFIDELKRYIDYYNNERISLKLKGMSPVQYRTHSQAS